MSDESERRDRRAGDVMLIEIHGMVKELNAHFTDHVEADKVAQKDLSERLRPVEELNTVARAILKIGGAAVALCGVGGVIAGIKVAIAHMK